MSGLEEFTGNVKQLISLQDRMREISLQAREARKPIKDAYDSTQENIINFMKDEEIHVCNYQDEKLKLQHVVRIGSFTKKTVLAGLVSYFGGDETKAQDCMDHVLASLGTKELDILKRVKARKPSPKKKGGKKVSEAVSAIEEAISNTDETVPEVEYSDSE